MESHNSICPRIRPGSSLSQIFGPRSNIFSIASISLLAFATQGWRLLYTFGEFHHVFFWPLAQSLTPIEQWIQAGCKLCCWRWHQAIMQSIHWVTVVLHAWIVQCKMCPLFSLCILRTTVSTVHPLLARSDARSGSKIAAMMHPRLIFMKGFSADLTFESAPKNISTMTRRKRKIFSFCAFASAAQYYRLPACDQTTKVNHHQHIMVDPSSQTLAGINLKCLHQKAFLRILPATLNRQKFHDFRDPAIVSTSIVACSLAPAVISIYLFLIFVKSQIPQNTWEHRLSPCSDLVIQSTFCFDKKGQFFSASGPTIICEYDALLSKADVRIFAKFTAAFTNFGCATKLQCFRGSILASFNIPQSGTRNSSSSSYLHIFCSLL